MTGCGDEEWRQADQAEAGSENAASPRLLIVYAYDNQNRVVSKAIYNGTGVNVLKNADGVPTGLSARRGPPSHEPAVHALGRSRGGFGTKIHLATFGNAVPVEAVVSAGQAHESAHVERVLDGIRVRRRRRPQSLACGGRCAGVGRGR